MQRPNRGSILRPSQCSTAVLLGLRSTRLATKKMSLKCLRIYAVIFMCQMCTFRELIPRQLHTLSAKKHKKYYSNKPEVPNSMEPF